MEEQKNGLSGYSRYFCELHQVQKNWGWFLALGILLLALGVAVISSSYYATLFSVILFGSFLVVAGVIQITQAFMARRWSGLTLSLVLGILYIITGFLCVTKPTTSAISLTLWISLFLFAIGLFRMLTSLMIRFENWGWVFFNGVIAFLLGAMIYADWPLSGLWVIGLFIGIDLILCGWSWVVLALTANFCSKQQENKTK